LACGGSRTGCLMRLLLVAADPMEFRAILAVTETPRKVSAAVDWGRTGRMNGHEVFLVANGAGWKRAAEATDAACAEFPPDRVISTGFCGALDPQLHVADVVEGTAVASGSRRFNALPVAGKGTVRMGIVCTIDHVAGTAEEKRALRANGFSAVEMEAAGVAERAAARGLPFSCVRAVTDLAGEDMANDFNRSLRSDGHFDTMRILGEAVRHPAARLPELIRLQRRCIQAGRALGEFFADCRF